MLCGMLGLCDGVLWGVKRVWFGLEVGMVFALRLRQALALGGLAGALFMAGCGGGSGGGVGGSGDSFNLNGTWLGVSATLNDPGAVGVWSMTIEDRRITTLSASLTRFEAGLFGFTTPNNTAGAVIVDPQFMYALVAEGLQDVRVVQRGAAVLPVAPNDSLDRLESLDGLWSGEMFLVVEGNDYERSSAVVICDASDDVDADSDRTCRFTLSGGLGPQVAFTSVDNHLGMTVTGDSANWLSGGRRDAFWGFSADLNFAGALVCPERSAGLPDPNLQDCAVFALTRF